MEISEMEYLALKAQVQTLQSQVSAMNKPKQIRGIKDMVKEQVISGVQAMTDCKPIFGYNNYNADAWTLMLQMAKEVHKPSNLFRMETRCTYGYPKPYINTIFNHQKPRKIADLTPEQLEISVQMLDEIIPIYNRYFKMLHQKVLYDPTGKGDYEVVGVVDEQILEREEE